MSNWFEPRTPTSHADVAAAERLIQLELGWYANPVYGDGDYPAVLKQQMSEKARQMGLDRSPLPEFTQQEIKLNKGGNSLLHY